MKTLRELLNTDSIITQESLLDDPDILSKAVDDAVIEDQLRKIFNKYPINEPGKDAYGRPLEVGDWVSCVPPGSKSAATQTFGVVVKLSPKRVTISIKTDSAKMGWQKRSEFDFSADMMNISIPTSMVFKIVDKEEFIKTLTL